jgi:ADP-ribose pyrophosphatase
MHRLPHWTVTSSRDVLDASPFLKVRVETVELPHGRQIPDYYQLEMRSSARMFAETAEGRIIVYRQYRHGTRRVGLVFPRGHLEGGEDPHQTAQRELLEETGFEADTWTYLGGFVVNANQGGAISHMFHATGCRRIASPRSDDLEESEILLLYRDELLAAIGRGENHLPDPDRARQHGLAGRDRQGPRRVTVPDWHSSPHDAGELKSAQLVLSALAAPITWICPNSPSLAIQGSLRWGRHYPAS